MEGILPRTHNFFAYLRHFLNIQVAFLSYPAHIPWHAGPVSAPGADGNASLVFCVYLIRFQIFSQGGLGSCNINVTLGGECYTKVS